MLLQNRSQEFLDKFTEEIILNIKIGLDNTDSARLEEERRRTAVEAEKLRQKFSEYGEKKPEIIPAPALQIQAAKPAAKMIPTIMPKKSIELPVKNIPIMKVTAAPGEADFGKIAGLAKDPMVSYIECPGVDKNIVIKKTGATIKTQIMLNKDEILGIIKSFSEKARIPLLEGMLNARIGTLEISAVVSEISEPSFIIKRMLLPPTGGPSMLQKPEFPASASQRHMMSSQSMPPITRPFTPGAPFQQQEAKKEEGFFSRKIKIG